MRLSSVVIGAALGLLALPVACSTATEGLFQEGDDNGGQGAAGVGGSASTSSTSAAGGQSAGGSPSTTTGEGGATTTSASGGAGPSQSSAQMASSSSGGVTVSVPCGNETCMGGDVCCVHRTSSQLDRCDSPGMCGSQTEWVEVACNGPNDCAPNQVCCGRFINNVGYLQIQCAATCTPTAQSIGIVMCGDDMDACPTLQTCQDSGFLPEGHWFCQ